MCGRFALFAPREEIEALFEQALGEAPVPRYNIAPTQPLVALRAATTGEREFATLRWGLIPFWAREERIGNRMINARGETVAQKPAFREPFRRGRRCLIPASGFYEWAATAGGRQPYFIAPQDGRPWAMAGLWDRWRDRPAGRTVESCTIVTVDAAGPVRELHERMPLVLDPPDFAAWLAAGTTEAELAALLGRGSRREPELRPVGRAVNNVRNEAPALIERVAIE